MFSPPQLRCSHCSYEYNAVYWCPLWAAGTVIVTRQWSPMALPLRIESIRMSGYARLNHDEACRVFVSHKRKWCESLDHPTSKRKASIHPLSEENTSRKAIIAHAGSASKCFLLFVSCQKKVIK
ncbi:potential glucose sensor [Pseudozyma hubeiensis SY62]|uniref:Potential glucose sensor n=1 Tax=Pseudozyma hubeiensis (strain SY62) TaxID=1305764 RepID=R9NZP5_PSEHS|nr:potential glucose sensor [Pseudozyma hubeiensis SY62]GAC94276.1 potential glucose sensor [Pseudozyma hubeiensis SY62]